jgi:4-hydroxy-2-oxoheptanedioate aldolase
MRSVIASSVYIGPSDLGFSLGLKPVLDRQEPNVLAIYEELLKSISNRGLFAGIHNSTGAYAARMIAMGFRFVTLENDSGLMARAEIDTTRKTAGDITK